MQNFDQEFKILDDIENAEEIYEKSLNVIQESMKDVIQELLILIDNKPHLVYIHSMDIKKGKVEYDYSTLSELPPNILEPHIEKCIKAQIENTRVKSKSIFDIFKGH
ncbi:hypothetical protein SJ_14 [Proteus phage SJ_PmiM]|nr:hypothetical protein SJ_14 [Proteus phage SJ_PmiM]